ncbi:MFS transporter, partial [Pseudomonas protegens]|uniref:MFS transporter n=1 Tax=Pseudomonas protegens TaxID=380021 RepID=UPI001FF09C44
FSFIVVSPLIFLEQLQLSSYEFSLTLLLYGAAYVIGGVVAGVLNKYLEPGTQIITGLCLIFLAGLVMLLLASQFGLSISTVLVPMIICTAGTTITRPAATCISLSPLAGTLLQSLMGWPGSFYVFSAIAVLVFLKALATLENPPIVRSGPRTGILQAYRRVCSNFSFVAYWLISAIVFACHFSFIVVSPLIFLEQLQLSSYEFSLTLLLYGAAYVIGGVVAGVLNKYLEPGTQIITGLCLIFLAGLVMLLLASQFGLSISTVLVPMIICTAGTTITRPAATSRAMELFPDNAGASASAGNTLIFVMGGLISAVINLSASDLQTTLALSFIALSSVGLLVNQRISRRARNLRLA